jgi:hypothetical protein
MHIAQCLTEPQAIKQLLFCQQKLITSIADIRQVYRYLGCYGKVEECRRVLLLLVTAAERGYRGLNGPHHFTVHRELRRMWHCFSAYVNLRKISLTKFEIFDIK